MKQWSIETIICGIFRFIAQEWRQDSLRNTKYEPSAKNVDSLDLNCWFSPNKLVSTNYYHMPELIVFVYLHPAYLMTILLLQNMIDRRITERLVNNIVRLCLYHVWGRQSLAL